MRSELTSYPSVFVCMLVYLLDCYMYVCVCVSVLYGCVCVCVCMCVCACCVCRYVLVCLCMYVMTLIPLLSYYSPRPAAKVC